MSYDRSFSSRGRGGRGRGGFMEGGSSRPYNKYEDRSPKEDFGDGGYRGGRRPVAGGQYSRGYERDDRRESREDVDMYKGRRDEWRGGRDYMPSGRRSPVEYRRDVIRGRPLSPPRKDYFDQRAPRREYVAPTRVFETVRRSDIRRDYSPLPRERHMSPVRYARDRYESSPRPRTFEREPFPDRRRNDFHQSNIRDYRDDRSRSPNIRVRGGVGNRFNGRGGRGRDNYNRFENDQRSSFNRQREEFPVRRGGRFNENLKRKVEPSTGNGIVMAKRSRDSSFENSP